MRPVEAVARTLFWEDEARDDPEGPTTSLDGTGERVILDRAPFVIELPELPEDPADTDEPPDTDATDPPQQDDPPAVRAQPCGCATSTTGGWWLALLVFAARRRRS